MKMEGINASIIILLKKYKAFFAEAGLYRKVPSLDQRTVSQSGLITRTVF
jgi:hypothetical protein